MVANVDLLLKEPVQIYLLLAVLGIDRGDDLYRMAQILKHLGMRI